MPRSKPPYHIGFVMTSFIMGGMEMRLADVVNGLDKSRWNPHIYAFYDIDPISDALHEPSRLHMPLSGGKTDLGVPARLGRVFRRERTAIAWVLTQGLAAGWGRLGALLGGVPVRILSLHGSEPLYPVTRLLNPWTDAIVVNSAYMGDKLRASGVPDQKIAVLHNGIDTTRYAPGPNRKTDLFEIGQERPVILNVGRLFHEKGRDIMLKAAVPLIQASHTPPLIVFAGEGGGSQRDELERLAGELGIAAHVRFLGIRRDVPDLLRAADVVVMSSRAVDFGESCPNVVLEGMASGVPVVGTDVGGTSELLINDETGFLIAPDDPAELAAKIHRLLDDADLRQEMGENGRLRVLNHFSIQNMLEQRVGLFERLLDQKGLLT